VQATNQGVLKEEIVVKGLGLSGRNTFIGRAIVIQQQEANCKQKSQRTAKQKVMLIL
jgi:hypothetical protein